MIEDDGPAVVMQYAPGGSLADLLRRQGRLQAGEVVALGLPHNASEERGTEYLADVASTAFSASSTAFLWRPAP